MNPNREIADKLIAILQDSTRIKAKYGKTDPDLGVAVAHRVMTERIQNLASQLIPHGENYGHAQRLHILTEGPDNG